MKEIWKDVVGYEGLYQVSNLGNVKSLITNKMLIGGNARNYKIVLLRKDNKASAKYIHRLVAIHFLDKVIGKNCVNHIDGNKCNNNISNLEWVTQKENIHHALRKGLITGKTHKVVQKTNGKIICVYKNPCEASKMLGISNSSIYKCLSNNYYSKTAGGYEWEWLK